MCFPFLRNAGKRPMRDTTAARYPVGFQSRVTLPVPSRGGMVFVDEAAEDRVANYL
jgi:hypothetical protein